MEDEKIWALYFAGVLALKFHPRNEHHLENGHPMYKDQLVKAAAQVADLALLEHMARWPTETEK